MDFPLQNPLQLKQYIKGLRRKASLTQADVGKLLGITQQSYQSLENNPEKMSVERLIEVLAHLKAELIVRVNAEQEDGSRTNISKHAGAFVKIPSQHFVSENEKHAALKSEKKIVMIAKPTGKKAAW
ncbi:MULTISPECIES: XRE family transcriptional regulator [unclassified Alishewanella]|uniref:XRE family transcriptional regulator n=1 Tax=unclassified Alishewanella TaxID=2628974 RepID=UPI0040416D85